MGRLGWLHSGWPSWHIQDGTFMWGTSHGGQIGSALVSRVGDRGFESMVESNEWLIKLIPVAS